MSAHTEPKESLSGARKNPESLTRALRELRLEREAKSMVTVKRPRLTDIIAQKIAQNRDFSLTLDLNTDKPVIHALDLTTEIEDQDVSFSSFARAIKDKITQKWGPLEYVSGDFRQETEANDRIKLHFDPWNGSFTISVSIKAPGEPYR